MILKLELKYFALFLLFLSWMGCDNIFDEQKETKDQSSVYLAVTLRAAHTDGNESINKDNVDFEDRVHNLAMLVFDSGSGEKIAEYFTTTLSDGVSSYAFSAKLLPGIRDFYFVANLTSAMQTELSGITDRTAMDGFMKKVREMDSEHYLSATFNKGFPMSRIYSDQNITKGGTVYNPIKFQPIVEGNREEYVKLIRVVAKLEVLLQGEDVNKVQKIEMLNANKHYRLVSDPEKTEPSDYVGTVALRRVGMGNTVSWLAYMPETFVNSGTTWANTGDNKPILYFRITTVGGAVYNIPVITHNGIIPGGKYLAYARATLTQKPDYSIYRNHHYKYEIDNVPNKIEIIYSISEWNVVGKEAFLGYGYSIEVDDEGKIFICNTIQNCDPHTVRLEAKNGAFFGNNSSNTSVVFTELTEGASQIYHIKKEAVPVGESYLEIYYNSSPGAGVTPDKKFIKK